MNPVEILRSIARAIARETGRQVDEDSFDRAAAYLNDPSSCAHPMPSASRLAIYGGNGTRVVITDETHADIVEAFNDMAVKVGWNVRAE